MAELGQTLLQLLQVLGKLGFEIGALAFHAALVIAWLAWALWALNWKKVWPVLAMGGWAPAALACFISALVWAKLAPSDCTCLRFVTVPNFFWQLGAIGLIASITLFCGWLQGVFHWEPAEIQFDPPAAAAGGHDHHH